jgi:HD superfamily phosphohydrolase YqeK
MNRMFLMSGALATHLNNSITAEATVLETSLDTDREMVHQNVVVYGQEIYFGISNNEIVTEIDNGKAMPTVRTFTLPKSVYVSDEAWVGVAVALITSEVNSYANALRPQPTVNDIVRSQAESEQGFSLA